MNKIIFNDVEFETDGYTKSTYFSGDTINSTANCSLINANVNALNELAHTPITTISIEHDGTEIYNLTNISARVDNINEYLAGDRMNININLVFDNVE